MFIVLYQCAVARIYHIYILVPVSRMLLSPAVLETTRPISSCERQLGPLVRRTRAYFYIATHYLRMALEPSNWYSRPPLNPYRTMNGLVCGL